MTPWAMLAVAIVLEIAGTVSLKLSDGFTKWEWGVLSLVLYSLCFGALAPALKDIPIGVAYAIWSGVGIAAITLIGIVAFGQRLDFAQYAFLAMIMTGAVGLRLTTAT